MNEDDNTRKKYVTKDILAELMVDGFRILCFRVSCLCAAWEVALQHGMKQNRALNALK